MTAPKAMLATRTDRRFSSDDWLFEREPDGVRALSERDGGAVELWSRNEKRIDGSFPELAGALTSCGRPRFAADGGIVAFDGAQTSFAALPPRIHLTDPGRIGATGVRVFHYLLDLLSFDGADLRSTPLRDRERLLRQAFRFTDPLRLSAHRAGHGEEHFQQARARGWEDLIATASDVRSASSAKRTDSRYQPGRSADWLKFTCVRDQESVVGGRALGRAGTGGTGRFHRVDRDGRLRHPRFTGLRNDKSPTEVVRE